MSNDLEALHQITDARYQQAQAAMQAVLAEERRVRDMLKDLNNQERSGRQIMAQDSDIQKTGGDLAWNSWIGRNRRILNMELANIMVRKERAFRDLQATFGKADVLEKMVQDQKTLHRKEKQQAMVNTLTDTAWMF